MCPQVRELVGDRHGRVWWHPVNLRACRSLWCGSLLDRRRLPRVTQRGYFDHPEWVMRWGFGGWSGRPGGCSDRLNEQLGAVGLAAAAAIPGLGATVDQHAAAVRDILTVVSSRARRWPDGPAGRVRAGGARPPAGEAACRCASRPNLLGWLRADWASVRLLAVCALAKTLRPGNPRWTDHCPRWPDPPGMDRPRMSGTGVQRRASRRSFDSTWCGRRRRPRVGRRPPAPASPARRVALRPRPACPCVPAARGGRRHLRRARRRHRGRRPRVPAPSVLPGRAA